MGKSANLHGNGPDHLDTWTYIKEIERMYRVNVAFGIIPGNRSEMGAFRVFLDAGWVDMSVAKMTRHVTVERGYPTPDGRNFWSLAYALCVKLDFELARSRFLQESIWPEA
jgi:hypothetical protein